jgi:hypothetical protein
MSMTVARPIFLIGAPRSGTTIIFEALAVHEDLGWWSNYSRRYPKLPILAAFSRIYDIPMLHSILRGEKRQHWQGNSRLNHFLPRPDECYEIWELCCGEKFSRDYLIDVKASLEEQKKLKNMVCLTLRFQGRSRFVAKITGPPRIGYLMSVFPNAIFIHVVRDGRAVVNSLLNVDFWIEGGGYDHPWWRNGLQEGWETEWENFGNSPIALAALQWRRIMEVTDWERRSISFNRYFEVKYEDYVEDPVRVMAQILKYCELAPSRLVSNYLGKTNRYVNMNYKYLQTFSAKEIDILNQIMSGWLQRFGYSTRIPNRID